jgi:hypothetical protein
MLGTVRFLPKINQYIPFKAMYNDKPAQDATPVNGGFGIGKIPDEDL